MLGTKYRFEYELIPDVESQASEGFQWYVVRLRNIGEDTLTDLEAQFRLVGTQGTVDNEAQPFGSLFPNEPKTLSFLAHVLETSQTYLSIHGRVGNSNFFWDAERGEVRSEQKISIKLRMEDLNKDLHTKLEQARQALLQQKEETRAKADVVTHVLMVEIKDEYKRNKEAFDGWIKRNEEDVTRTKREAKAKIEAQIEEIKNEDFTTWSKKNEEDAEKWMTGEANA